MTFLDRNRFDLHMGGAWAKSPGAATLQVSNPATGDLLGEVVAASADDVDHAARAAHRAYGKWKTTRPSARSAVLRRMAAKLREHGEELAYIDSRNSGGPIQHMRYDVTMAADGLDFFAGLASEIKGETIPLGADMLDYTLREPLGVVARIVAFNHPLMFAARAGAALAAGNAVIVKPAEQTPLSALRLAELWADCGPAGLFSVVTGGSDTSETLVRHPLVAKVSLVGSIETGRAVLRACADSIKSASLELGGKNALIACPDADPAKAADGAVRGMNFAWAGQSCGSTSRILLHESIHDKVLAHIVRGASAIRPGPPEQDDTAMGPLISARQRARALDFIAGALAEGARLVCGGAPLDDPQLAKGHYLLPTVLADVTPAMRLAREEVFGPVMAVMRWSDETDLVDIVNALEYGLTCSIWTHDLRTAHRLAGLVDAGYVWVNDSSRHFQGAPFGGVKQSGMGREEHLSEMLGYTRVKNVNINLAL